MQTPKEQRPRFFEDPAIDRLAAIVTALTAEVSALADRVDTMETLLAQKGALAMHEIDAFKPGAEEAARRRKRHDALISRVFYVLREEFESLG